MYLHYKRFVVLYVMLLFQSLPISVQSIYSVVSTTSSIPPAVVECNPIRTPLAGGIVGFPKDPKIARTCNAPCVKKTLFPVHECMCPLLVASCLVVVVI